jgi:predicted nucleic acid-binding protein
MIAVDTNVLMWGVRGEPDSSGRQMVERCAALFQDLSEQRAKVMVPSIVLAEFLQGQDIESQRQLRAIIGKRFFVAPFDAQAAGIAAELYATSNYKQIQADCNNVYAASLKADYKVVATAIAHGATKLYADDTQISAIAHGRILVVAVPELRPQRPARVEASHGHRTPTHDVQRSLEFSPSDTGTARDGSSDPEEPEPACNAVHFARLRRAPARKATWPPSRPTTLAAAISRFSR